MSISPDTREEALTYLRGRENPFDILARPQMATDRFAESHVPALLSEPRQILLTMIDSYIVPEYASEDDLPPTRVVTIRGPRGAGKTHLLHSLLHRQPERRQLIIRPTWYSAELEFKEYLLAWLRSALVDPHEIHAVRPFEWIAETLTRKLLLEAVRSLDPVGRVLACSPGRWQRWLLLLGHGDRLTRRWQDLADRLDRLPPDQEVRAVFQEHGFRPEVGFRLISGHLEKVEKGSHLLARVRRRLYEATARWALMRDESLLLELLESGTIEGGRFSRQDTVPCLLACLIESCALTSLPVVFAFDNAEGLFAPKNTWDDELVRSFLRNVAQTIDQTKGLLLLFFIERGLYQVLGANHFDEFIRPRWMQSVLVKGASMPDLIDLQAPTWPEIQQLVKERIDRLLTAFPDKAQLPELFPFPPEFQAKLAGELESSSASGQSLRTVLTSLRGEYSRIVHPPILPPVDPIVVWHRLLAATARGLGDSLAPHRQGFHAGLGQLLQHAMPLSAGDWTLRAVQPLVTVGSNPAVGLVSVLEWGSSGEPLSVAVGLLLAGGSVTPTDLAAKLEVFNGRTPPVEQLIVLWPSPNASPERPEDSLPKKTHSIWMENKNHHRSVIRLVSREELRTLLTFSGWLTAVVDDSTEPLSKEEIRTFIHTHCRAVLQLVSPAPVEERSQT
jgi:hypothetical protein